MYSPRHMLVEHYSSDKCCSKCLSRYFVVFCLYLFATLGLSKPRKILRNLESAKKMMWLQVQRNLISEFHNCYFLQPNKKFPGMALEITPARWKNGLSQHLLCSRTRTWSFRLWLWLLKYHEDKGTNFWTQKLWLFTVESHSILLQLMNEK